MRNTLDLLASVSRLAIAAAVVYFGYQLAQINASVGSVTQTVDGVTRQIPPTLDEVREIRLEVAAVRAEIPVILAEVEAVRTEIPPVLTQLEAIHDEIPAILAQIEPILQRVDRSMEEVAGLQRQIPQILHSMDNAVAALNQTRDQVVPLVPPTLEEIRLTREMVDPTLDRVDGMLDDAFVRADQAIAQASQAGQQASEGAITGFFTGLVKLPFKLVGTLASPLVETMDEDVAKQMTERDLELMAEAGARAAEPERLGEEIPWQNTKSGNSGSITIVRNFELENHDCVEARIKISNSRKELQNGVEEFCRVEDGAWIQAAKVGDQSR